MSRGGVDPVLGRPFVTTSCDECATSLSADSVRHTPPATRVPGPCPGASAAPLSSGTSEGASRASCCPRVLAQSSYTRSVLSVNSPGGAAAGRDRWTDSSPSDSPGSLLRLPQHMAGICRNVQKQERGVCCLGCVPTGFWEEAHPVTGDGHMDSRPGRCWLWGVRLC